MPSGWDSYFIIFLSAALFLILSVIFVFFLNFFITRKQKSDSVVEVTDTRLADEKRMNTRFYQSVNVLLIFISLLFLLIPVAGWVSQDRRALVILFSLGSILGIGMFYCGRKGDLSWNNQQW